MKFIVIAEIIEHKGFLISYHNSFQSARKKTKQVFERCWNYERDEIKNIENDLDFLMEYRLQKNSVGVGRVKEQMSNGNFSVSILEVNKSFTEKHFIQEIENNVFVFDISENDKVSELIDLFPDADFVAN